MTTTFSEISLPGNEFESLLPSDNGLNIFIFNSNDLSEQTLPNNEYENSSIGNWYYNANSMQCTDMSGYVDVIYSGSWTNNTNSITCTDMSGYVDVIESGTRNENCNSYQEAYVIPTENHNLIEQSYSNPSTTQGINTVAIDQYDFSYKVEVAQTKDSTRYRKSYSNMRKNVFKYRVVR